MKPDPTPDQPAQTMLDAKTLNLIRAANLANLVKAVKSGKPLSKVQLAMLEAAPTTEPEPQWHPHQKSNGKKATNAEIEERVEAVAQMLLANKKRHEIRNYAKKRWSIHWRTVDEYTVRAKAAIIKRAQITKEEAQGIGVAALLEVIATGKGSERVSAERNFREIFGYSAPTVIRPDGKGGATVDNPQASAPQVILTISAGRAEGIMPTVVVPENPAQTSPDKKP